MAPRSLAAQLTLAALTIAVLAVPAGSSAVPVINPGFEDFVLADGQFTRPFGTTGGDLIATSNPIPGWTLSDPNGDGGTFNPTTGHYPAEAPEGQNVAYSSKCGKCDTDPPIISQVLSAVLTANTLYKLSVDVGNRLDHPFPGYTIQLLAGGVVLAEDNNTLSPAEGTFATSTIFYAALPIDPNLGQNIEIRLRSFGLQTNFDNVRLVPELSTALLLLLGLGSLAAARRRSIIARDPS